MDATLILIDSDAELARARTLVDQLWNSNNPSDVARLGGASAPDRQNFCLPGLAFAHGHDPLLGKVSLHLRQRLRLK